MTRIKKYLVARFNNDENFRKKTLTLDNSLSLSSVYITIFSHENMPSFIF